MSRRHSASIAVEEVAQFTRHAEDWWNPDGKFKPLHRLNPVRLAYVREQVCEHFGRDRGARHSFKGLKILDVGCGGGLLSEPLARLGGHVTGLDASEATIALARQHAKLSGLTIDYCTGGVETLARKGSRYDLIFALEIIEHVADVGSFLKSLATLLKPNGLIIMSTLNRTSKSFLLGIVAAEYVLGWVPRGTHQWNKFIRPSELVRQLDQVNIETKDISGLSFNPLRGAFVLRSVDIDVNYILTAVKR